MQIYLIQIFKEQTLKMCNYIEKISWYFILNLIIKGHQGAVYSVSFSPDGNTIASSSAD